MMFKHYLRVVIALLVLGSACQMNGIHGVSDALEIKRAHYHKEVPGVEDMPAVWDLRIEVGPHKEVTVFDSVFFRGAWKKPKSRRHGTGSILNVRVEEWEVNSGPEPPVEMNNNEALIYYTIKNKKLYKRVTKIKQTETIYLP